MPAWRPSRAPGVTTGRPRPADPPRRAPRPAPGARAAALPATATVTGHRSRRLRGGHPRAAAATALWRSSHGRGVLEWDLFRSHLAALGNTAIRRLDQPLIDHGVFPGRQAGRRTPAGYTFQEQLQLQLERVAWLDVDRLPIVDAVRLNRSRIISKQRR